MAFCAAVGRYGTSSNGAVNFSDDIKSVTNKDKLEVVVSRNAACTITDSTGKIIEQYKLPYGATLQVKDLSEVDEGTQIASWDPYTRPIISETAGKVKFTDIYNIVYETLNSYKPSIPKNIDDIIEIDNIARVNALNLIKRKFY